MFFRFGEARRPGLLEEESPSQLGIHEVHYGVLLGQETAGNGVPSAQSPFISSACLLLLYSSSDWQDGGCILSFCATIRREGV